jgi:hypothetical protein
MKEQTGKPSSGKEYRPPLQKIYVLLVVPDSVSRQISPLPIAFQLPTRDQAITDMNLGWC